MTKFPYGLCDFYDIITENYFYADRTGHIPKIETAGKHLLFLRPRRFGKSLLLSMLENYYDIAKADRFDKLFGHLHIGKNPTKLHSRYFVMKWDFSAVSPGGEPETIQQNLYDYVNSRIRAFSLYYRDFLTEEIRINPGNAQDSFQSLLIAVQQTEHKLYLLIDEYDNFANEVMMGGRRGSETSYKSLVYGEGYLKSLFKVIKAASAGQGLDRTFITGVSPVVLSDITSGHNIAENSSLMPEFNDLCGFSETETGNMLGDVADECGFSAEKTAEALLLMRTFYNGYCFSQDSGERVYNPTLALYFLKNFQKTCAYPRKMLDGNLAPDRGKLIYISGLPGGEKVIADALGGERPVRIPELSDRFGVEDVLNAKKDRVFMASLLYYFGVLTLSEEPDEMGELVLRIPNLVIRKLYAERIREMLLPESGMDEIRNVTRMFYRTGDMQPLCDLIEKTCFAVFDNRDYLRADELTVKTVFLSLLYNDSLYIMDSETPIERRYADLTMIVRPDMRHYELPDILMEFKYIPLHDTGLTGAEIRKMSTGELGKIPAVQKKCGEAEAQAREYGKKLVKIYGDILRLRVYSVLSVGFERLVWQAVK